MSTPVNSTPAPTFAGAIIPLGAQADDFPSVPVANAGNSSKTLVPASALDKWTLKIQNKNDEIALKRHSVTSLKAQLEKFQSEVEMDEASLNDLLKSQSEYDASSPTGSRYFVEGPSMADKSSMPYEPFSIEEHGQETKAEIERLSNDQDRLQKEIERLECQLAELHERKKEAQQLI